MRLHLPKTYLTIVQKSVGSPLFQTLWAEDGDKEVDILRAGEVSCAYYVSSLLKLFDLVETQHATVHGLEQDLKRSKWHLDETFTPGMILVWETQAQVHGEPHEHIGIYIGNERAISHSDVTKTPVEHHITFEGTRNITKAYTNPFLLST